MNFLNTVICYNNPEEVIRYISGILSFRKEGISFAVVINEAERKGIRTLVDFSKSCGEGRVCVYHPGRNLGYLNGLLYGYKKYVREHTFPDYVIFSNTDIEIRDNCFFDKIENKNYSPEIGCIGPSIYVENRKAYDNPACMERRPRRVIDRLLLIMSIPVLRGIYVYLSDVKGRFTKRVKRDSGYVYEVHGCYFILSDSFARLIAKKKYGALMYSEEAYIAENTRKYGFKTYYDSDLEVVHLEHSVTKWLGAEKIAKAIGYSMRLIREEFYGESSKYGIKNDREVKNR